MHKSFLFAETSKMYFSSFHYKIKLLDSKIEILTYFVYMSIVESDTNKYIHIIEKKNLNNIFLIKKIKKISITNTSKYLKNYYKY